MGLGVPRVGGKGTPHSAWCWKAPPGLCPQRAECVATILTCPLPAVGEPVAVPKVENPSRELVDRYHELYIRALLKLFNENKTKYGLSESDELHIL